METYPSYKVNGPPEYGTPKISAYKSATPCARARIESADYGRELDSALSHRGRCVAGSHVVAHVRIDRLVGDQHALIAITAAPADKTQDKALPSYARLCKAVAHHNLCSGRHDFIRHGIGT